MKRHAVVSPVNRERNLLGNLTYTYDTICDDKKIRIGKNRENMTLNRDQAIAQGIRTQNAVDLGIILRNRRKKMGYTQEELADMLGFSSRLVGEIERGRGTVGIDKVLLYATTLGIDIVAFER